MLFWFTEYVDFTQFPTQKACETDSEVCVADLNDRFCLQIQN